VAWAFASPLTTPAEQPFADGIFFVSLADLRLAPGEAASHALLAAWARALDLPANSCTRELRESVIAHLKNKEVLMVLDNLEGVRPGASEIEEVVRQTPDVKILATSRAPLHLEFERVLHVDGLGLPVSAEDVEDADASALFLQEARRVQVGFNLPDGQRPYLVKICEQLGGFPLALLLAARWAPVLPCSEMVRELADGVDVLATPEPDLPERHRSLRRILDSALAQLSNEERALAQRLAEMPQDGDPQSEASNRTTTDMLPGLRVLSEQALISVDSMRGTARLHPLLWRYVRGSKRGRRGPIRVA
jgi:predicted ATPase